MIDKALTVPCKGIGVWEGAAVIHGVPGLDRRGVVLYQRYHGDWAVWLFSGGSAAPQTIIAASAQGLHLDLTHQPTYLTAMARLAEKVGVPHKKGVWWGWRGHGDSPCWLLTDGNTRAYWSPHRPQIGPRGATMPSIPGLTGLQASDDSAALAAVCRQVFN